MGERDTRSRLPWQRGGHQEAPVFSHGTPPPTEPVEFRQSFRVIAKGSDTIHDWIRLKRTISDDVHIVEDPLPSVLPLGMTSTPDNSTVLTAAVHFDPDENSLKLEGQIQSRHVGGRLVAEGPGGMFLNLGEMFGGGHMEEETSDTEVSIPEIAVRLSQVGFDTSLEDGELRLTRTSTQDAPDTEGSEEERQNTYTLHRMEASSPFPMPMGKTNGDLCLHLENELVGDDQAEIEARYQEFADVYGTVAKAILEVKGAPTPTEDFVIKPPDGLQKALKKIDKQITNARRQAGMLMGGDVDAEVEKMILKERPNVTFENIGGLTVVKDELANVVLAINSPELFTEEGTHPPRGVLLYGEPGVGKTLAAKALAAEANADFYAIKIGDVLHSLYGKTERVIQSVFDRANENGPAIIFIDELDALAAHRDKSSEVTSRIVSVLLTNMDGLEERNKNIIVVGATNRLDAIDTALLRPGRFDLQIEVPLPDPAEREDIFSIHMREAEKIANRQLFVEGFDLNAASRRADRFSGADIAEVIRRVLVKRVRAKAAGKILGPTSVQDIIDEVEIYRKFLEKRKSQGQVSSGQYL